MKSTGEVMGIAKSYPEAYAKTQLAIDYKLPDPSSGKVFISVCDRDKRHILSVARILRYLGFDICSTEGTARVLRGGNVTCEVVEKISGPHDGERPNIGDLIADGKIAVIVNTPYGPGSRGDGYLLRTEAVRRGVTCVTAMSAANTYVSAIEAVREEPAGSRQRQRHGHGRHRPAGPAAVHGVRLIPSPGAGSDAFSRKLGFAKFSERKARLPPRAAVTWLCRVLPKGLCAMT